MSTWNPNLYLKFATERTRPATDLIFRVHLNNPAQILDVGCGPGNSAATLHERWPEAVITGLDSSAEMLDSARDAYPQWKWILGDVASWESNQTFDLVFSNAALQWVPNHSELLPRIFQLVSPGGAMAIQVPYNFQSPVHQIMAEVSHLPIWNGSLTAASRALRVEPLPFYYDLLRPLASSLDLWMTEYLHVLESPGAIVEWMRGTGMRPYLAALPEDNQKRLFQDLCLERFIAVYRPQPDGKVLFPFRRLFVIAYR